MIKDFFLGISTYLEAVRVISALKLWRFVIIPSIIALILAIVIFFLAFTMADDIGAWLIHWYPWDWGKSIIENIVSVFGGILIIAVGLIIFKQLVMIVSGPFMSPLSERVEKGISSDEGLPSEVNTSAGYQMVRGIRIALRNVWRELLFTFLLFILGLIPIFTPFTTIGILFVQGYYFGFGNIDFALERHFGFKESVQFVKRRKSLAIGNGLITMLGLMSVIGFIFILPIGVVAATIAVNKQK